MTVLVNDKPVNISSKESIQSLLVKLSFENSKGIAVAQNQHVIQQQDWHNTIINENDEILIIGATQGG